MSTPPKSGQRGYEQPYAGFDSPLMRQLRQEAYGEDIGQHSWVTVGELRGDLGRLALSASSRVLDLGCGPGGPLTFLLKETACTGTGVDVSAAALESARQRATRLGVERQLTICLADMNQPLPLPGGAFEVAVSLDVVLHARDRLGLFREIARVLTPRGRFLFTDAAVLGGTISSEEVAARSVHGFTQFSAPGCNERLLVEVGFRVLHTEDRTASLLANAAGRLAARAGHREELEQLEGAEYFSRQQRYLESVIMLSKRGALARVMFLAEASA